MPLQTFFADQLEQIRSFMASGSRTVHVVQLESDVEPLLKKMLVGLDEEDDNPSILVRATSPFFSWNQYFNETLAELARQNEMHRSSLTRLGLALPHREDDPQLSPERQFNSYVSRLADELAEWIDSYVVVVEPREITDETGFRTAVTYLATSTVSTRAKFLVLDRHTNPILANLDEENERTSVQVFHLTPNQIEHQIDADLADGRLSPPERRRYTAMMGAFAFARRNYDEAERVQRDVLEMAKLDGTPVEQANACYNLGNTYLKQAKPQLAEDYFSKAVGICAQESAHALMAMALTNLGVALLQLERVDLSLESFEAARRIFRALNHRPGEAFVLDNKAATLAAATRNVEAERSWIEALDIYDSITAPSFAKLRQSGRDDIVDKLRRFYESTGQTAKLSHMDRR